MSGDFGAQFGPDESFIRWGWDRIMGTTDLPLEVSEPVYASWRDAFVAGDPRRESNVLHDALSDIGFRWPWLDQCFDWIQRVIEPVHGWPYTWRTPRRKLLRLPKSTIDLLSGEIANAVYQARNRTNYARLRQREPRPNLVYEVVLVGGWGCPAEDAIAHLFVDRFAAGDGTSWPPFFPGDRTMVRFDVLRRPPTSGEIARCAIRTVEPLWPLPASAPLPAFPAN